MLICLHDYQAICKKRYWHHVKRYASQQPLSGLHGAAYGSKGIANFILSPATPLNLIVAASYGVEKYSASSNIVNDTALFMLTMIPSLSITHALEKSSFYNGAFVSKNSVIDTDGKKITPTAHLKMMQAYKAASISRAAGFCVAGTVCGLLFGPSALLVGGCLQHAGLILSESIQQTKVWKMDSHV